MKITMCITSANWFSTYVIINISVCMFRIRHGFIGNCKLAQEKEMEDVRFVVDARSGILSVNVFLTHDLCV